MTTLFMLAALAVLKLLFVAGIIYTIVLLFIDDAQPNSEPDSKPEPRKHPKRWRSHSTKH